MHGVQRAKSQLAVCKTLAFAWLLPLAHKEVAELTSPTFMDADVAPRNAGQRLLHARLICGRAARSQGCPGLSHPRSSALRQRDAPVGHNTVSATRFYGADVVACAPRGSRPFALAHVHRVDGRMTPYRWRSGGRRSLVSTTSRCSHGGAYNHNIAVDECV